LDEFIKDIVDTQVISSNGKPVNNLKGFVQIVERYKEEFLKFERLFRVIKKSIKIKEVETKATPSPVKSKEKAAPTKHKGGPKATRRKKR
jgi:PDZ domain